MRYFVDKHSIVREIWGNADSVLFIFAGASAEFALNKAVDWLYFTGKLPADPLGRLFSTVVYSQQILFSELDEANKAIDKITSIHKGVEQERGAKIPDWAYRDVLFMLIDYSIRAYEQLYRKLSYKEKAEVFNVFYRVGLRMGISGLPETYIDWQVERNIHLEKDLVKGKFTVDLFKQYRKHLGTVRYFLLRQVQLLMMPEIVRKMLSTDGVKLLAPIVYLYRLSLILKARSKLMNVVLPDAYKQQIIALNIAV